MLSSSPLERALHEVAQHIERGDLANALRFADRARRLGPDDPALLLLQGNLQLQLGMAVDVVELLRRQPEHDGLAALRAEAQCLLEDSAGRDDSARRADAAGAIVCCRRLLAQYAVDAFQNIASLAGRLVRRAGAECPGWVGLRSDLFLVGEAHADASIRAMLDDMPITLEFTATSVDGFVAFWGRVPAGTRGVITATGMITGAGTGPQSLLGSALAWPPEFRLSGWAALGPTDIVGEAHVEWAPHWPVPVRLRPVALSAPGRDEAPLSSETVGPRFALSLPETPPSEAPVEVLARLPDGRLSPLPQGIARLTAAPELAPMPPAAVALRTEELPARELCDAAPRKVDIVVPVYGAASETLRCLQSVFATCSGIAAEIIVVDDASPPDDALSAALTQWAASGRITRLVNAVNVGFPAAANRGMALHGDRDVVLLNSDTEVFGDWLLRLQRAAYAAPAIGTVTPLGGRASIASYPDPDSDLPSAEARCVDALAARVNAGAALDVPVGVGFCLFIKRACLNAVGSFDAAAFGRGYGEENDLCLRASRAGWRHVVAADVYVRHSGGRSFGVSQLALRSRNGRVLSARYPDYDAMVSAFHTADPLRTMRRALDFARLLDLVAEPVLLVTLALPGGVERHVDARRRSLEALGHTVLELRPATLTGEDGGVRLRIHAAHLPNLRYDLPQEWDRLRGHLLELELRHVDVHHFLGLGGDVLKMVTRLGVPYRVFVHDHAWICPRVNLLSAAERYCGEPELALCETCVRENGTAMEPGLTVAQLRARSADILGRASRAIVPAADTARRLARYFPTVSFEVEPWEIQNPINRHRAPCPNGPVRVAVIGAIGIHKGYSVLLQCAADARARALSLEFVVIGHTHADDALLDTGRVFITGPYADDEVQTLLRRESCDLAWFPSVTPETWCYALTHALAAGLPVLAFDLGAIGERLRAAGQSGSLVPLDMPASRINDLLLHARADIVYKS